MIPALAFLALASSAAAHLPFIELERARKSLPEFPGEDLSFEAPFDVLEMSKATVVTPNAFGPPKIERIVRPQMSLYLEAMLNGPDDVDYYLYNKTSADVWTAYSYPIVPVCKVYKDFAPEVAFIGPLGVKDEISGEVIFKPVQNPRFKLPEGYGAFIFSQQAAIAAGATRETYYAPEAKTSWWLPYGWPAACIDGWKQEGNPENCDFSKVIFFNISAPGEYYFAFYDADPKPSLMKRDVALVIGTVDAFVPEDFIRVDGMVSIVSEGRSISNYCIQPDAPDSEETETDSSAQPAAEPVLLYGIIAGMAAVIVIGGVALLQKSSQKTNKVETTLAV